VSAASESIGTVQARPGPAANPRRHAGDRWPPGDLALQAGCHLCDDARLVIEAVTTELGVGFTELDITADDELYTRWWEQIR